MARLRLNICELADVEGSNSGFGAAVAGCQQTPVLAGRWLLLSVKLCGLKCLFKVPCSRERWGRVLRTCQKPELCCARSLPQGLFRKGLWTAPAGLRAAPELPSAGRSAGSRDWQPGRSRARRWTDRAAAAILLGSTKLCRHSSCLSARP